ncbi:MAG: metalloendopeptidase, partial [Methylocystis sp.]|nr:metalloendopeptidase [Methylocystis sp.]
MNSESAPPTATYFDGYVIRQRPVSLEFGAALDIFEDGAFLAAWPYGDIRRLPSPTGAMRIRSVSAPKTAWLDITDPAQQREVETHCKLLGGEPPPNTAPQRRRLAYGALAAIMIGAFLYGGAPRMAGLNAPLIPVEWEKKLGEAVDEDIHEMFPGKKCDAARGAAALKKLSQTLQDAAH